MAQKKKARFALNLPDDTFAMRNTIAWCSSHGFVVRRVSPYQIKVGPWNCWPDTGRFNRDDMPKSLVGVEEFLAALTKWHEAQQAIFETEK